MAFSFKDVFKVGDYVLIAVLIFATVFSFFALRLFSKSGHWVSISVNNHEIFWLSLKENRESVINGPAGVTRFRIENGSVWISEAPCHQKICTKMGKIKRSGEVIVCIPNRIIIQVQGKTKQIIDAITM